MLFNYYVFNIITIICFIKTLRITIYPSPSPKSHRSLPFLTHEAIIVPCSEGNSIPERKKRSYMMPKVDLKKEALPLEFARGDASSRQHTYAGQGHGRKKKKLVCHPTRGEKG